MVSLLLKIHLLVVTAEVILVLETLFFLKIVKLPLLTLTPVMVLLLRVIPVF
jgi:hypothetical protein